MAQANPTFTWIFPSGYPTGWRTLQCVEWLSNRGMHIKEQDLYCFWFYGWMYDVNI